MPTKEQLRDRETSPLPQYNNVQTVSAKDLQGSNKMVTDRPRSFNERERDQFHRDVLDQSRERGLRK